MLIRTMNVTLTHNGWVYEKVCLDGTFKLAPNLLVNFLIHLVITSTVKLHKCLIEKQNKNF